MNRSAGRNAKERERLRLTLIIRAMTGITAKKALKSNRHNNETFFSCPAVGYGLWGRLFFQVLGEGE